MDFKIDMKDGVGTMSFVKNSDIRTNIYLSINILKGTWFQNKDFGMARINKITKANILLQKQYAEEALAWMIKSGRAVSVQVIVEQDLTDISRINMSVTAKQPDGLIVTYTQFIAVGGPSTNSATDVWYTP